MPLLAGLFGLLLAAASARATDAGPPPLDPFFGGLRVRSVAISPDARYVSLIVTHDNHTIVGVKDLAQRTPLKPAIVTAAKDEFAPQWCAWANATRLLCDYRGLQVESGKLFPITRLVAVDADGSSVKVLASSSRTWSQLQDYTSDGHGQVRLGNGTKETKLLFFGRLDGERPWKELARVVAFSDKDVLEPVTAITKGGPRYGRST